MNISPLTQITTPRKIEYKHSPKDNKINTMISEIDYLEYNNQFLTKLLIGITIGFMVMSIPASIGIVKLFGG